jgi:ParB family transcriptional regulator, chromosome partitioning protein
MSNTSKNRLGRGLDALIPSGPVPAALSSGPMSGPLPSGAGFGGVAVLDVPIDAIVPNHQQPRSHIQGDDALHELADSIREHGILQPLIVALDGDDGYQARYQLIAGERRWRAAQLAGLATVPVVLRDATQREMLELALVENLQRADLNPLEAAHGYKMLMEEYGLTQDQVAERVGRSRPAITNTIRLLQLPAEVREMLIKMPDIFTEGHARAVLAINSGDAERIHAMQYIVAKKLTVREAEDHAKKYNDATLRLTPDRRGGSPRVQSLETRALQDEFTRAIEMKARLQRSTRGKGSLTVYFTNEQQLQLLYQRLVAAGEASGFDFSAGGGLSAMDDMIQNGFDRDYRGHGGNGRGSGN